MAIKTVLITNPDISKNERGYLSKRYTGGTEMNVENAEGFTTNDYIVVGKPGYERTEQGQVSSATTLFITLLAALNLPHDQDTSLFFTLFNQYSLEYQTSAGGAWTVFSDMPKDIEWDDIESQYITAEGNYYAFRWRFYNSTTTKYSAYSPTMPAAGWARNSGAKMIENVRRLIKDKRGELATDEEIMGLLDDGQQHISAIRKKWWFLRVDPASFTATEAGVSKYDLPGDFDTMDRVMYNYVSGASIDEIYRLRYKKEALFDMLQADQTQTDDDEASYWTMRAPDADNSKGYIELYPTPETVDQGFKQIYFKEFTTIDSAGDTTECPRPEALEFHAAAVILETNDREDASARMEKRRDQVIRELEGQNRRILGADNFLTFRGQRGWSKIHQRGARLNRDSLHENYFTDEFR